MGVRCLPKARGNGNICAVDARAGGQESAGAARLGIAATSSVQSSACAHVRVGDSVQHGEARGSHRSLELT